MESRFENGLCNIYTAIKLELYDKCRMTRPTRRRMRRGRVLSSLIFLNVHSEFIFRAREQVDDDGVKIDGKRVQLTYNMVCICE